MNQNQEKTIKRLEQTSNKALEFLNAKTAKVNEKVNELASAEEDIRRLQALGLPIVEEKQAAENLAKELYNIEFDISDLNQEQKYMNAMIRDLRELNNVEVVTYGDAKKHKVKAIKDKEQIKKFIGDSENKLKELEDEAQKDEVRKKIIDSENYMGKLDSMINTINEKFSDFIGIELEKEEFLSSSKKDVKKMLEEKKKFEKQIDDMYLSFSQTHKGAVDNKLNINALQRDINEKVDINETYGASHADLYELGQEMETLKNAKDKDDLTAEEYREHLDSLNQKVIDLTKRIEEKNKEIDDWEEEVSLLQFQIAVKDRKIATLEAKLDVWKDSYNTFKQLVIDLAEYVGYPESLGFDGEEKVKGRNPLEALIKRVQKITEFVQEQGMGEPTTDDNVVVIEEEDNNFKYVLGGVAIAALAFSLNK